eukprot:6787487-Prymnesium_polylepis.1
MTRSSTFCTCAEVATETRSLGPFLTALALFSLTAATAAAPANSPAALTQTSSRSMASVMRPRIRLSLSG